MAGKLAYKNIDAKKTIERVMVICSTDGRIKVYYDEQFKNLGS